MKDKYMILFWFGIFIIVAIQSVFAIHDCESIIIANSSGKLNKSFINCNSEPVLNITYFNNTTTINEIKILNFTFDDVLISKSINNQTKHIQEYFGDLQSLNFSVNILAKQNEELLNENMRFRSQNPSYDTLSFMYNNSLSTQISSQQQLQREIGNKPLYILGGGLGGFVVFSLFQRKQQQPEERLFPSGGRTKGEDEEVRIKNIDTIITEKIKELGGRS